MAQNRFAGTGYNKAQQKPSYKKWKKKYNASKRQKKIRAMQNAVRRHAIKTGKVKLGDNKTHVHHKNPVSNGGSNDSKNLSIVSAKKNMQERNRLNGGRKKS